MTALLWKPSSTLFLHPWSAAGYRSIWGSGAVPDDLTAIPDAFTSSTGGDCLGAGSLPFLTLLFEAEAFLCSNLLQVST